MGGRYHTLGIDLEFGDGDYMVSWCSVRLETLDRWGSRVCVTRYSGNMSIYLRLTFYDECDLVLLDWLGSGSIRCPWRLEFGEQALTVSSEILITKFNNQEHLVQW